MNALKQRLLSGWHLARWIRLILGTVLLVQAIDMGELLYGVVGVFFLFQAFTNTGCCSANSCSVPPAKNGSQDTSHTHLEK